MAVYLKVTVTARIKIQDPCDDADIEEAKQDTLCDYDVEGMTDEEIKEECFKDEDGDHCIFREV